MENHKLVDKLAELILEIQAKDPIAKEFTLESHPHELISEANEVLEAVEKKDWENLKEELGDVLWDWIHICHLSEKRGLFTTQEVLELLEEKIHRRNPHVFGDVKIETKEEAREQWQKIKRKEKEDKNKNY